MIMNLVQGMIVGMIRLYQWAISPVIHFLGGPSCGCRFYPSCSAYAIGAVRSHGAMRGLYLSVKRILRCNPWGGQGLDPVPPASSWDDVLENRIGK